jgi:ketosteroid isomerase-like protein
VGTDGGRSGGRVGMKAEPSALTPTGAEAVSRAFARAILARDPQAAASWFAPAGLILTADGTEVVGRVRVAEVLTQITAPGQEMKISLGRTVTACGVAACTQFWRRLGRAVEGGPGYEAETVAQFVLSFGVRWEITIADPWQSAR